MPFPDGPIHGFGHSLSDGRQLGVAPASEAAPRSLPTTDWGPTDSPPSANAALRDHGSQAPDHAVRACAAHPHDCIKNDASVLMQSPRHGYGRLHIVCAPRSTGRAPLRDPRADATAPALRPSAPTGHRLGGAPAACAERCRALSAEPERRHQAIDRYDPTHAAEFVAFARPTIEGQIKRFFHDTSWPVHVPRRQQELFLTAVKTGDRLRAELGRDASTAEIAADAGGPMPRWITAATRRTPTAPTHSTRPWPRRTASNPPLGSTASARTTPKSPWATSAWPSHRWSESCPRASRPS